ncbi:MAG: rod shape-determining protein MreD [Polaromonas sp.]|nr:rod shape-determining protein MreD [Polaromonas sp.]
MIMRPGKPLLLPASPWFIWSSLVAALALNMLLNMGLLGRAAWTPDLLALTLVFWGVHQPQRVSVGLAFAFGLAMDVHHTALLGQHAFAYTALGFMAAAIHRRLLWFPIPVQALHVVPLFVVAQALVVLIRLISGSGFVGWSVALSPLLTALLWPVASLVLLVPQRRPHDPDANRPL